MLVSLSELMKVGSISVWVNLSEMVKGGKISQYRSAKWVVVDTAENELLTQ